VQPGQRVLIVRGGDGDTPEPGAAAGVGRDWLAAQLRASGALVDLVVAYERCLPVWTPERLSQGKMALLDGWTWLFSSSEAVANLGRLLPKVNAGSACALTTHARIAQAARVAGFGVVRESRPTLDDVLASIESPL
jgi:uroporphyrinogen-III synthase